MKRNILLFSYSFNRSDHRGVYQYAKSLKNSFDLSEFDINVFTQMYKKDFIGGGGSIFEYLNNPNDYFLKKGGNKEILLSYFLSGFFLKKNKYFYEFNEKPDSYRFKGYINSPIIYYRNNINLLLPGNDYYVDDISVPFFGKNDLIFTDSPLSIKSTKHKVVQTVHDLIPIQEKRKFHKYFYKRLKACSHANKILCVSEYSKLQYLEYFPAMEGKVEVVYQPLPADEQTIYLSSLPDVQQEVLDKYNLKSKQYMYYVGAIEERKNIHNLIKAYTIATNSDKSCPLVISGSVDDGYSKNYNLNEYLVSYTDFDKVSHNIMKTDFVSDIEKLVLLRNSRAFLFPSLSEGFGIPVIEAQTLCVPVMTSNNTSLPEVTNGSALLLENPLDIEEMVEGIKKLWNDDHYCSSLILLGNHNSLRFTKEKFKDAISQFLETV